MKASLLPRYLLGSRSAILEIAASRSSFLIGVIFVFSAGLAREYDGEDLLHEPWHVLRPLLASLMSGGILFLVVHLAATAKKADLEIPILTPWKRFMGLFWMTAPMAWLYAIPYERFLSPVDAIKVNLWTLGVVAAWRVLLMIRVVHVLYGFGYLSTTFFVLLFADAVALLAVTLAPTPVIDVMGGIRHTDRDALVVSTTLAVTFYGIISAPVWIIGAIVALVKLKPKPLNTSDVTVGTSRGLLILAVGSVLAFTPLLWIGQPEQIQRYEAETLLRAGKFSEALALMSQRDRSDYPPHWDPPPETARGGEALEPVREAMLEEWPKQWVAEIYLEKISRSLLTDIYPYFLEGWPEAAETMRRHPNELQEDQIMTARFLLEHPGPPLRDADRRALAEILELGGKQP